VCTADLGFTGGTNDIGAANDNDFIGACTPALILHSPSFLSQKNNLEQVATVTYFTKNKNSLFSFIASASALLY
jgi:hypothetical protein